MMQTKIVNICTHGRKCMWIRRKDDGLFCGLALKHGKRVRLDNKSIKKCDKKTIL